MLEIGAEEKKKWKQKKERQNTARKLNSEYVVNTPAMETRRILYFVVHFSPLDAITYIFILFSIAGFMAVAVIVIGSIQFSLTNTIFIAISRWMPKFKYLLWFFFHFVMLCIQRREQKKTEAKLKKLIKLQ